MRGDGGRQRGWGGERGGEEEQRGGAEERSRGEEEGVRGSLRDPTLSPQRYSGHKSAPLEGTPRAASASPQLAVWILRVTDKIILRS